MSLAGVVGQLRKEQNPAESTTQPEAGHKKLNPELERFIDRVLVPCLVKRHIRQLKEGKQPTWERDGVAAK
jgi:hypothetical protein